MDDKNITSPNVNLHVVENEADLKGRIESLRRKESHTGETMLISLRTSRDSNQTNDKSADSGTPDTSKKSTGLKRLRMKASTRRKWLQKFQAKQ